MERQVVLAVDQSTSGTKALAVDREGNVLGRHSLEHAQYYPQPGWVEHDPTEIYGNVVRCIRGALRAARVEPRQLAAIAIANQRETAVVWDRRTGLPVHRAIVWQCDRTAGFCSELRRRGFETLVRDRTGLVLDPYFSASKFRWILDRLPADLRHSGQLLAGTIDSWLIWKLTNGAVHATDGTNASRTSLFNIRTLEWDPDLLACFGIDGIRLPEVKSCDAVYGCTADPALFADRVPIAGVIGDSQAALFGQLCHRPGMAKATYGTGTSVLMNVGSEIASPRGGLVAAIAWVLGGRAEYALEGVIRSTGDTLKWVKDRLGLFGDYAEAERLAAALTDNEGVYLVPAFVGLGAPYWNPDVRAAILGLGRTSGKAHIIRAALESIAYQVRDTVELMEAESGIRLRQLRADGGGSDNRFLMQFQADMLQTEVVKPEISEFSALGAAYLGGMAVGLWRKADLQALAGVERACRPKLPTDTCERYYAGWKAAVRTLLIQDADAPSVRESASAAAVEADETGDRSDSRQNGAL